VTQTGRSNIPTVGIHHNSPAEVYHSWEACSHSWLNCLRRTPAHLLDLIQNGSGESTAAQILGTAIHCAVLEPDRFESRYAIREEGTNGTTKAGKQFKAESEQAGKIVLSATDGRLVRAIDVRARSHPRLNEWLRREHANEVSLVWERDGYMCKARVDLMVSGINVLADPKTTTTGDKDGFARQVAKYRYHDQAAWYLDGAQRLTGQAWDWWFVVCEKKRPFLVSVQGVPRGSEVYRQGVEENERLFALYRTCRETGKWPGYADVEEIVLPEWSVGTSDSEGEDFGE